MAYSMDLRLKVIEALDEGESVPAVARRFGIGVDTVRQYKQQRDEHCEPIRLKTGPKKPMKRTPEDDAKILEAIRNDPGITLREMV